MGLFTGFGGMMMNELFLGMIMYPGVELGMPEPPHVCGCAWPLVRMCPPTSVPPTYQGKGRVIRRAGQAGSGRALGGERPVGTAAYGGRGFKARARVSGERPMGAPSCRQQYNRASYQHPRPPPPPVPWHGIGRHGLQWAAIVCSGTHIPCSPTTPPPPRHTHRSRGKARAAVANKQLKETCRNGSPPSPLPPPPFQN